MTSRLPAKLTPRPRSASARAFTLVELLVVIAILALLVSVLLPALGKARDQAKLAVCRAHLSQLGLAVITYADVNAGLIPRGPAAGDPHDFVCADYATNQIWIGATHETHPYQYHGLGVLLPRRQATPELLYCPADDTSDPEEELPRIGTNADAYGSFLYRQLDQLPEQYARGVLGSLGATVVGETRVPVETLAFDMNSFGPGAERRTNHEATQVNVLYQDRSVRGFANVENRFSLRASDFDPFWAVFSRLDALLVQADYGYRHDPAHAPALGDAP